MSRPQLEIELSVFENNVEYYTQQYLEASKIPEYNGDVSRILQKNPFNVSVLEYYSGCISLYERLVKITNQYLAIRI